MRTMEFYVQSRLNSFFLVSGKLVRFSFFLVFIISLLTKTHDLAGFSLYQTVLFYMTFNFIDITSQFFSRGVYAVKGMIDRGQIDLFLTQPLNVLFRIFSDLVDILDLTTLIPVLAVLAVVISRLDSPITLNHFLLYILLCANGLLIAASVHIFVVALTISTQQISNQIWIYRDIMTMGRFPADIYSKFIQFTLTFIIPIAIMVSFPSKALLGLLSTDLVMTSFIVSAIFFLASLFVWKQSLKHYSSVSV